MHIGEEDAKLKVLVVIASYGEKNLNCLRRVIERYRAMNLDVNVVVTAEAAKSVDLGVEVRVGTPTRHPHSLPFAHKQVFADNVDRYDLFVYTEDDIDVSEECLRAFVRVTRVLDPWELAGYIRYEVAADGERILPDVHGPFHWRPESVRRRGEFLTAQFTNQHAGFYVLTNDQLRRALASGAFLEKSVRGAVRNAGVGRDQRVRQLWFSQSDLCVTSGRVPGSPHAESLRRPAGNSAVHVQAAGRHARGHRARVPSRDHPVRSRAQGPGARLGQALRRAPVGRTAGHGAGTNRAPSCRWAAVAAQPSSPYGTGGRRSPRFPWTRSLEPRWRVRGSKSCTGRSMSVCEVCVEGSSIV